jgi:hypothetical protein
MMIDTPELRNQMQNIARKTSKWWPRLALAAALAFVAGITVGGTSLVSSIERPR